MHVESFRGKKGVLIGTDLLGPRLKEFLLPAFKVCREKARADDLQNLVSD